MAAMRSYKKRSYKKRRAIRKLKTTLRRKIQRGGNPALITPCIIIFMALFGNSPVVKAFITILEILAGMPQRGGNSKNFKQRGGNERLSTALKEFNSYVQTDDSIGNKDEIAECVNKLTSSDEPIVMPPDMNAQQTPEEKEIAIDTQGVLDEQTKVQENSATNTNIIENIKTKYSGLIDKVKTYYVKKAEGLTDDKKECIKTLLRAGFTIMKSKLSNISATDVILAQRTAALEKLSEKLNVVKDVVKDRLNGLMNSETGQNVFARLNTATGNFKDGLSKIPKFRF